MYNPRRVGFTSRDRSWCFDVFGQGGTKKLGETRHRATITDREHPPRTLTVQNELETLVLCKGAIHLHVVAVSGNPTCFFTAGLMQQCRQCSSLGSLGGRVESAPLLDCLLDPAAVCFSVYVLPTMFRWTKRNESNTHASSSIIIIGKYTRTEANLTMGHGPVNQGPVEMNERLSVSGGHLLRVCEESERELCSSISQAPFEVKTSYLVEHLGPENRAI